MTRLKKSKAVFKLPVEGKLYGIKSGRICKILDTYYRVVHVQRDQLYISKLKKVAVNG